MENLRTIRDYIYEYQNPNGPVISIPAASACIKRDWSDWCMANDAFAIDMLAEAQKLIDSARKNDNFDPFAFIEDKTVLQNAEKILYRMCNIWTNLGRTKDGRSTWKDYMQTLRTLEAETYKNFISQTVTYIQIRIRELYN